MKKLLGTLFTLSLLVLTSCGSSCPTQQVTQDLTDLESYEVTMVDSVNPEFTASVTPDQASPGFQVNFGYTNPNKPVPADSIRFHFFFRDTALPGGVSIFDQAAENTFTFPDTPYDGNDIIYKETAPNTPDFIPTTYSGQVVITDANHVLFDLTFTNGDQTRKIESVFFFQTATFDQPIGECD